MLERYTAFTQQRKRARFFRVWHLPWKQAAAEIEVTADTLLASTGLWWKTAGTGRCQLFAGAEVWWAGRTAGLLINCGRLETLPRIASTLSVSLRLRRRSAGFGVKRLEFQKAE